MVRSSPTSGQELIQMSDVIVLTERQHLELIQRGDIHVKVRAGYRLITDKRDGADKLIDLGYNLYTITDPDAGYKRFLLGPKGDIVLPMGDIPLSPSPAENFSKQVGRDADKAQGTANKVGCAVKGCMLYLVIWIALDVLCVLMILLFGWK
jgi:hypothetical protein